MSAEAKDINKHIEELKKNPKGVISRMYSGRIGQKNFGILAIVAILAEYALSLLLISIYSLPTIGGVLTLVISLMFTFCVLCHLFVRRLHDIGQSGLYAFIFFIAISLPAFVQAEASLILLVYIILLFIPGTMEENEYGEVPDLNRPLVEEYFNKS